MSTRIVLTDADIVTETIDILDRCESGEIPPSIAYARILVLFRLSGKVVRA
jgi:hypothetical protein